MDNIAKKLLSTGLSLAGGFVGSKVVEIGWRGITGDNPPSDVDDDTVSITRLVAFATISAGISALIQVASQRGANKALNKISEVRGSKLGAHEV